MGRRRALDHSPDCYTRDSAHTSVQGASDSFESEA